MATNSNENNIVKRDGIDSATDSISSEINHQHANLTANRHVELGKSIVKNPLPPLHKAVFTSTKVLMASLHGQGHRIRDNGPRRYMACMVREGTDG